MNDSICSIDFIMNFIRWHPLIFFINWFKSLWNILRDDFMIFQWRSGSSLCRCCWTLRFFLLFFIFYCKTDKTHYAVKNCVFLSFLGGIRGFFILTRDLEKKRKFFSLVLGKIREVSLPFVVDGSDIALWRILTGRRHHLLYYSGAVFLIFQWFC